MFDNLLELSAKAKYLHSVCRELQLLFKQFPREMSVWRKPGCSLVSDLDFKLNQAITKSLKQFSGYPIISEETIDTDWPPATLDFWLIDPLDGTHNFLVGLPTFGTMVTFIEKGEVRFSAIFLPVQEILSNDGFYFAGRGLGAFQFRNGEQSKIFVSGQTEIEKAFLLLEGPAKRTSTSILASRALERTQRSRGSLSFCWSGSRVAAGGTLPVGVDALISYQNQPWDNLPVCLLIEEAGGKVTDFYGQPWSLKNCRSLLFSNRLLHEKFLSLQDK